MDAPIPSRTTADDAGIRQCLATPCTLLRPSHVAHSQPTQLVIKRLRGGIHRVAVAGEACPEFATTKSLIRRIESQIGGRNRPAIGLPPAGAVERQRVGCRTQPCLVGGRSTQSGLQELTFTSRQPTLLAHPFVVVDFGRVA